MKIKSKALIAEKDQYWERKGANEENDNQSVFLSSFQFIGWFFKYSWYKMRKNAGEEMNFCFILNRFCLE